MNTIILFFLLLITSIFSSYGQNENEIQFERISDSLKKYQVADIFSLIESTDTVIFDYIELDYNTFKNKYSLTDEAMTTAANALEVTYSLARVDLNMNQALEELNTPLNELQLELDSLENINWDNLHEDSLYGKIDSLIIKVAPYENDTIR